MPTRCRNFNDDGSVKQPCSKGNACRFIHPDHPGWAAAYRYDHSNTKGRGGFRGRGGRASSGPRGAPPFSAVTISPAKGSSGWGDSSKEASTSSSISWDTTSWGTPRQNTQTEPSTSSAKISPTLEKSGWGSPVGTASKGDSHTWGAAWGAADGSGWGSGDTGSNGWEATGSDRNSSGWGGIGGAGWGADRSKSKGKGVDVAERGNGWNTGSSGWDAKPQPQPQFHSPAQPPPPATEGTRQRSRTVIPSPATTQAVDEPKRLLLPGKSSTTSTKASTETKKTNSSLKIRTQSIPAAEPVLTDPSGSVRPVDTPLNRAQVYSNTIKYTQQAIRLQIELEDAQANVERWKRTQSSPQYTRATPATRRFLDAQRATYAQEVAETKKQLTATIKYLAELPDLSAQSQALYTEIDEQELMAYTTGLRDWIRGLHLWDYFTPPKPSSPPPKGKEMPKDRKELIWDWIVASADSLDERSDRVSDALYTRRPRPVDVDATLATLQEAHEALKRGACQEASVKELLDEASQVGDDLGEIAEHAANLLEKDHEEGQVLAQLKAELERIETAKAQVQGYLDQLERWKIEDDATIEDLRGRLQTLYKIGRPSGPSLIADDLLPAMKTLVISDLESEIITVVNHIREAYSQNGHAFIEEIYKQLQPILEITNAVCRRADAIASERLIMSS